MDMEQRIQAVAQQYRDGGYTVFVRPHDDAVPAFAKDHGVDILAKKGDENVIVQVALNRDDFARRPQWQRLAEMANAASGWRFDLVVLEPETQIDRAAAEAREPSDKEIALMLDRAERMLNTGDVESACVYAWGALEAAMRRVRDEAQLHGRNTPREIMGALYSNGFLAKQEFDLLRSSFQVRTQVVHGLVHAKIDPAMVHSVIEIARRLIGAGEKAEAVSSS
jgi:uncharacterized protein YutE (UPF0331/DUF86 family)